MRRIAIISCKSKKQDYTCSADEMYSPSILYRVQKEYIQKGGYDKFFILSSKYGIIPPEQIIEPYNIQLKDYNPTANKPISLLPLETKKLINQQLSDMIGRGYTIDLHFSNTYYKYIDTDIKNKVNHIKQPPFLTNGQMGRYRDLIPLLNSKPLDEVNKMISGKINKPPEQPQTYYHLIHGEFFGTSAQLSKTYKIDSGNCYKLHCGYRGTVMTVGWVRDKTLLDKLYQTDSGQWRLKK